jgi:hypothetical protein
MSAWFAIFIDSNICFLEEIVVGDSDAQYDFFTNFGRTIADIELAAIMMGDISRLELLVHGHNSIPEADSFPQVLENHI